MITYEISQHDHDFETNKIALDKKLLDAINKGQSCSLTEKREYDHVMCSERISYRYTLQWR